MIKLKRYLVLFLLVFSKEAFVSGTVNEFSVEKFVYIQTRIGLKVQRGDKRQQDSAREANRDRINNAASYVNKMSKILYRNIAEELKQYPHFTEFEEVIAANESSNTPLRHRDPENKINQEKLLISSESGIKAHEGKSGYVLLQDYDYSAKTGKLKIILRLKKIPSIAVIEKLKKLAVSILLGETK